METSKRLVAVTVGLLEIAAISADLLNSAGTAYLLDISGLLDTAGLTENAHTAGLTETWRGLQYMLQEQRRH